MASGGPVMNGDVSCSSGQSSTLEETLQQMNKLIQENRLKEDLRQTNLTMKQLFEGLSAWREKQRKERDFLEQRLEKARGHVEALTRQNQDLNWRLEQAPAASCQSAEFEALRGQVARLQAEKNDLVALNSELLLKSDESFIEIIKVRDEGAEGGNIDGAAEHGRHVDLGEPDALTDQQEVTVSQLLQSLRKETQRGDQLQVELRKVHTRYREVEQDAVTAKAQLVKKQLENERLMMQLDSLQSHLEQKRSGEESNKAKSTQTVQSATKEDPGNEDKTPSEVDSLKSQMRTLFKDLQQAQSKLDEAEGMKKNLQDRYREVEQDAATLKAQLVKKQSVQTENERLKLQLDSLQAQSQLEQKKAGEERNSRAQLEDAYTKLFEDYKELKEERKKRESQMVKKEVMDDLQIRLTAAEEALAVKQGKIDDMKQEIFQKETELETISVFQAQAEVYSADFYAERAAREKLHEEKERLAAQLEFVKKQNHQMQEEMQSLGRRSLTEMQMRHVSLGGNAEASLVGRGPEWQHQGDIPEHACPKCNEILPDLDSLQIHIMDCIN